MFVGVKLNHSRSMVLLGLILLVLYGPGRSVGIATGYGLDGLVSNPSGDEIFQTGPGVDPASCTIGIGSFPG